jgi:hypothetical protein
MRGYSVMCTRTIETSRLRVGVNAVLEMRGEWHRKEYKLIIDLSGIVTTFKCAELFIDGVQPVVEPSSYKFRAEINNRYYRVPKTQTFDKIPGLQ